jgi:hypothetical protein
MYRTIGFIVLACVVAGCTENNPPAEKKQHPTAQKSAKDSSPAKADTKAASTPLTIPPGAQWTIYCQTVSGPNHVLQATQIKENLIQTSGMSDWYLLHGERESTIYYGFYKSEDPADPDGQRAHAERARLDALTDGDGNRPFRYSIIVPLSAPDPLAPPEWNLENAPANAYWSVQIGAYKDSPERKLSAVQAVREARAAGIEAYYYHSDNVSHVCIGAWPESAVVEKHMAAERDASKPVFVLPSGTPDAVTQKLRLPDDEQATRVAPKIEIVDPSLLATFHQYPEHAVNGEVNQVKIRNPKTGQIEWMPEPSLLVTIPRRAPSILAGDSQTGTPAANPPAPTNPAPRPTMTDGLKSIGG